jgi:hypothetical protein
LKKKKGKTTKVGCGECGIECGECGFFEKKEKHLNY